MAEVKSRKPLRCSVCQTAFVPLASALQEIPEVAEPVCGPTSIGLIRESMQVIAIIAASLVAVAVACAGIYAFASLSDLGYRSFNEEYAPGSSANSLLVIRSHVVLMSLLSIVQTAMLGFCVWRIVRR